MIKDSLLTLLQFALMGSGVALVLAAPYTANLEGILYWSSGIVLFALGVVPFLKAKIAKREASK
ncbi:MAG: hypothetical protein CTY12_02090 [Methylotenera sp.]|nr:MAG: hypothetical protein CTY12_02090 [Methylotenera sp.]